MARRLRYQRISKAARELLRTEGESGRFEFKREPSAVTQNVLVAAANAVVLDDLSESQVTILVGVDESEDPVTGLVTGTVAGLANLEDARSTIRNRAADTLPSPVALTIIEENTATQRPFLRIEVGPTTPPHFTRSGRRITRYGASTRAITDEELLRIYLDREADHFRERFSAAVREVADVLGRVEDYVSVIDGVLDEMQQVVGPMADDASTGANAAEEAQWAIDALPDAAYFEGKFAELTGNLEHTTDGEVWVALQRARRDGWELLREVVAGNQDDQDAREAVDLLGSLPDARPQALGQNIEELRGWESLKFMAAFSRQLEPADILGLAREMMERRASAARPVRMSELPPIE